MIKRILVALSGTPFTPSAVRHAVELAGRHEAELTGVTVIDARRIEDVGPVPIGGGAAAHALAEHRRHVTEDRVEDEIKAFEVACAEAKVACSVVRETGDCFEQFISRWRYHDLTIIGLRGLFEYGVIENPDDEVTQLIARGVRPIIAVSEEYRTIKRVLIAYDGSMEAAKAMKRFVQMRLYPDVQLEIAIFDRDQDEADALLSESGEYCRAHGLTPELSSLPESARVGIHEHAAKTNADLIVLGSAGRGKIAKFLLGDTTAHAIKNAAIPLYLAR